MRPPQPEAELTLRPLTRHNDAQIVYQRLPEVEAQIAECLPLEHNALLARLAHDYDYANHVKDEAVCYLIRESLLENKRAEAGDLMKVLLKRQAKIINRRVRGSVEARHAEDCIDEVTTDLVTQIINLESDKSDFAQVRFGMYFKRLTADAIKRFLVIEQREQTINDARDGDDDKRGNDKLDSLIDEKTMPLDKQIEMREGLEYLAPELREVFVLRHYDEWQIEAASPHEPSISRYCQVSGRTIRNRLKQAEIELQNWRAGKTK